MKDYLANKLPFKSWKEILRVNVPENAENLIHKISKDNKYDYDRSYAAVCALVESYKVANVSQMVQVVNETNQIIAKRFREKFIKGWYLLHHC